MRPAALVTAVVSLVALYRVHWAKGFFITAGGYEYALTLLVVSLALLIDGAGRLSLDACLSRRCAARR